MIVSDIELTPPRQFVENVTAPLLEWRRRGLGGVLATLVGIDGASPRPLGSQLAVNERGEWVGQISSDCAEAAIAREALACMADGEARTVRYGRGSKFLDVRLPCGSGLDIHFDPHVPIEILEDLEAARRARKPVTLRWSETGQVMNATGHLLDWSPRHANALNVQSLIETGGGLYARHYVPVTRVLVAGRGAHASALVSCAHATGLEVCLATPDRQLIARHADHCVSTQLLHHPDSFDAASVDRWTATVLLFHDHDWEPEILVPALQRDGFYVGALGSRLTHQQRCERLIQLGVDSASLSRVHGPVGLDIGAQSPPEIAISIIAEILKARRMAHV
ncbi:MAG: XdhC family protein [Hyphomicrobiaceae bacterium]|nr:XdhC family protein [Hyphomicrobiaceae bacterium]MCC0011302.1 XdhC family protein [Hyphomicrobiaceae bacterium]